MTAIFNLTVTKRYIHELFKFVETFSKQEELVQQALAADDSDAYFKLLVDICIGLRKIYAHDLSAEWMAHIGTIKKDDVETTKFLVSDFLVQVSMLTFDIQTALFQQKALATAKVKTNVLDGHAMDIPVDSNSIMVIDDMQMLLNTIKTYMKDTGYDLICMSSPEEALTYLTTHRPALFFLDIEMPDMDGFTLAKKIRETGHDAPIVFMTGNSNEQNLLNAIEADAAGFLVKPIPQVQLLSIVDKFMR